VVLSLVLAGGIVMDDGIFLRSVVGEFLGTAVLILLGGGVCASVSLEKCYARGGGWIVITAGWAFAVLSGILVATSVGAPGSLNPAGTIAGLLVGGGSSAGLVLSLVAAQLCGAFVGSVLVWLMYLPHWEVTESTGSKLGVFCTGPAIDRPICNFLSELIGTFALVLIAGSAGRLATGAAAATLTAAVVWAMGLSLGSATGYALNPARDLAPRLAHAVLPIAGKGGSNWRYAWVPVCGPLAGAILASVLLQLLGRLPGLPMQP
jgi:glycerol uptake facilitator protein